MERGRPWRALGGHGDVGTEAVPVLLIGTVTVTPGQEQVLRRSPHVAFRAVAGTVLGGGQPSQLRMGCSMVCIGRGVRFGVFICDLCSLAACWKGGIDQHGSKGIVLHHCEKCWSGDVVK